MAAAWGDYDNDGFQDLVVTGYGVIMLFKNHQGRFEQVANFPDKKSATFPAGVAWGDYDNDGRLDLYVCNYVKYKAAGRTQPTATAQYGREVPYTLNPSSYEAEQNLLFHNNGDGTFTECAEKRGVHNPTGRSLNAVWRDFDENGWLDLYVANDISDNALYLNNGGRFTDSSHASWVADYRGAMGLTAGDWNNDGDEDLFITHWIAQENALYDSLLKDNTKPGEPLRFMDVADMTGLGQTALQVIGWGTQWADLDNDGYLDLLITNGSTFETDTQPPRLRPMPFFLFRNHEGKRFYNIAPQIPALNKDHVGRGLAAADYDLDGDLDFLTVNHQEGVQLFRNDSRRESNWIILELRNRTAGGENTGQGEGARVVAVIQGRKLVRSVGNASYLSQSSRRIHLGLGAALKADRLEVHWIGGHTDIYTDLSANTYWRLREGNSAALQLTFRETQPIAAMTEKQRITAFWKYQRAAVQAMTVRRDPQEAARLFKLALQYDARHEDSLYYLGQTLEQLNRNQEARQVFQELVRVNPRSHRGYRQLGLSTARAADTLQDLDEARLILEQALAVNSEETGVRLLLGEIHLIKGETAAAKQHFQWVCQSNPKSAAAFYYRAYIAWHEKDSRTAQILAARAMKVFHPELRPAASAEGDTNYKMFQDSSILSAYINYYSAPSSDGAASGTGTGKRIDPGNRSFNAAVFAALDSYLKSLAATRGKKGKQHD